jgi:hypothetical protein
MTDVPVTGPTTGLIVRVGEPVTTQLSVLVWAPVILAGVAVKLVMVGGPAGVKVTVTAAVTEPNGLVAVRVYKVVVAGVTTTEVPVTAPTPALMLKVGAPVTTQFNVLDWPAVTLAGVAVKLVMLGAPPTVTVAIAETVPKALLAVRV